MKTKHSSGEDDPIVGFCKATSESRESALFFLEGFSWDLDNSVSSFLQGQLPPVKKPPPLQRSRDRSPSRRIYSTSTSAVRPKHLINADETSKTVDATQDDSDDISHGGGLASMVDPVNHESEQEGSVRAATESTSTKIGFTLSDHDSDSTS